MKWILIYCVLPAVFYYTCNSSHSSAGDQKTQIEALSDSVNFSAQVQPILEKRCSPCHFPGGKMYERMPFDQDTTILNHTAGILKRIKNEDENAVLKAFIQQNSPDNSSKH